MDILPLFSFLLHVAEIRFRLLKGSILLSAGSSSKDRKDSTFSSAGFASAQSYCLYPMSRNGQRLEDRNSIDKTKTEFEKTSDGLTKVLLCRVGRGRYIQDYLKRKPTWALSTGLVDSVIILFVLF